MMGVDHPGRGMSMPDLIRTIRRIARQTIQNASIGRAGIRVYDGGWIRIEDGGLQVTGTATVTGRLEGSGTFDWTGPMNLKGAQSITGPTTFTGQMTVNGPWKMVGNGEITGNVKVLAGGTFKVGNLLIDPDDHGGMITLPNGGQVMANGNAVEVWSPGPVRRGFSLTPSAIHVFGANVASSAENVKWLAVTTNGELMTVHPSVGGPGGELRWPFPESTVSSEYGPRESPTPGGSTFHEGIDFGIASGTPIPAAGSGTVVLAGVNGGYGNCVIIDHGNGLRTLYGHMRDTPSVSAGSPVARGQIIGLVGSTGISSGAHLHLEVHVNGTPVNPRTKLKGT